MIECRIDACDLSHTGARDAAAGEGWVIVSPNPAVPALCPLHAEHLVVGSEHVFGPEYEQLASRVPVDGDTLLTVDGIYQRLGDEWVLEQRWDWVGAAA